MMLKLSNNKSDAGILLNRPHHFLPLCGYILWAGILHILKWSKTSLKKRLNHPWLNRPTHPHDSMQDKKCMDRLGLSSKKTGDLGIRLHFNTVVKLERYSLPNPPPPPPNTPTPSLGNNVTFIFRSPHAVLFSLVEQIICGPHR